MPGKAYTKPTTPHRKIKYFVDRKHLCSMEEIYKEIEKIGYTKESIDKAIPDLIKEKQIKCINNSTNPKTQMFTWYTLPGYKEENKMNEKMTNAITELDTLTTDTAQKAREIEEEWYCVKTIDISNPETRIINTEVLINETHTLEKMTKEIRTHLESTIEDYQKEKEKAINNIRNKIVKLAELTIEIDRDTEKLTDPPRNTEELVKEYNEIFAEVINIVVNNDRKQ